MSKQNLVTAFLVAAVIAVFGPFSGSGLLGLIGISRHKKAA
jgi:hypothetical protein